MPIWKPRSQPSLTFEAYGVQVQVMLEDGSLGETLRRILPPGARECKAGSTAGRFAIRRTRTDGYSVSVGETPFTSGATLDVALGLLDQQMRLYIAAVARDWIFVHAGVVSVEERAIVLPGPSFSGKTTLVAALVKAGATYFSDEYAVVDVRGRVHPYPRPLSIRSPDGTSIDERHVAELGGVAGDGAADVALVAALHYRPGAEWQPERISAGRGMAALLRNTVPAQDRPKESMRALKNATVGSVALEGVRGEVGPAAEELLSELAQAV
jgi:hypothetical protein